ncbi:MAG: nucleotidyltransferase domain-containing protein [Bdellovibrio sp.]|nr:nucleotidyltransferase domain-containing protein [Bdellovibrio sp.]
MLKKNSFGLTQIQKSLLLKIINSSIKKNHTFKVWIFGSRARGDYKKYSDIDLLLEVNPSFQKKYQQTIRNLLEDSVLPFKVDLLLPSEVYKPYRKVIEKEKKLLKERKCKCM